GRRHYTAAAGGGKTARLRSVIPIAGGKPAAEYFPQRSSGTVYFRQSTILQSPWASPGGHHRENGLRFLSSGNGGEISAGRPAGHSNAQTFCDRGRASTAWAIEDLRSGSQDPVNWSQ